MRQLERYFLSRAKNQRRNFARAMFTSLAWTLIDLSTLKCSNNPKMGILIASCHSIESNYWRGGKPTSPPYYFHWGFDHKSFRAAPLFWASTLARETGTIHGLWMNTLSGLGVRPPSSGSGFVFEWLFRLCAFSATNVNNRRHGRHTRQNLPKYARQHYLLWLQDSRNIAEWAVAKLHEIFLLKTHLLRGVLNLWINPDTPKWVVLRPISP